MGNLSLQLIAAIPANLAYGSWGLFAFGLSGHSHKSHCKLASYRKSCGKPAGYARSTKNAGMRG